MGPSLLLPPSYSKTHGANIPCARAESTLAVCASGEDSAATGIDGDQTNNTAPDSGAAYVFQ